MNDLLTRLFILWNERRDLIYDFDKCKDKKRYDDIQQEILTIEGILLELQNKHQWISVKDALPADNERVLLCEYSHLKDKKFVTPVTYLGDNQWEDYLGEMCDPSEYEPTHWMRLPMPPECV